MIQSQSPRTHLRLEVSLLHYNNQLLWTLVMVQTISMFQQFLHQFIYFNNHELFILSTWKKFIVSWTSSSKVHLSLIIVSCTKHYYVNWTNFQFWGRYKPYCPFHLLLCSIMGILSPIHLKVLPLSHSIAQRIWIG